MRGPLTVDQPSAAAASAGHCSCPLCQALICVARNNGIASAANYRAGMTTSEKAVFEGPLHQLARNTWQLLFLIGILGVALGVIVLAWPGKTLLVAGVLFGIYLVMSGIGYVFAAFGTHAGAAMRVRSSPAWCRWCWGSSFSRQRSRFCCWPCGSVSAGCSVG